MTKNQQRWAGKQAAAAKARAEKMYALYTGETTGKEVSMLEVGRAFDHSKARVSQIFARYGWEVRPFRPAAKKLNEKAVLEARSSSESAAVLAEKYGVTRGTIDDVRAFRTWKHVRFPACPR